MLQLVGEDGLAKLTVKGPFVTQEDILDQLLGDGRTALGDAALFKIIEHCAADTPDIDAVVGKKALVLGGDRRLDEAVGDLLKRRPLAIFVIKGRQQPS